MYKKQHHSCLPEVPKSSGELCVAQMHYKDAAHSYRPETIQVMRFLGIEVGSRAFINHHENEALILYG
jgi:hypothetical protein